MPPQAADAGNLSPQEKRELLRRLLQERAAPMSYPLSHGQQALWFLYRLAPGSAAYNFKMAARLRGPFDARAMRRTCDALLARHPTLRTSFNSNEAGVVQRVQEHAQPNVQVIDAARWTEAELREQLDRAADVPFDFEKGPPVRISLWQRSSDENVLLLMAHHIAVDFWSFRILTDDLLALYAAEVAGVKAWLPPVEHTYADYVTWQREMLAGPEGDRLRAYWLRKLAGDLPVLKLATDRPRPPVQTFRGAPFWATLPTALRRGLESLARSSGASLYTICAAAFQVLLQRYTGQDDILVGAAMTGRTRKEFQDLIGFFINTVVLRGDLSGNPTFRSFLEQFRGTLLEAMDHQDYPLSLLVQQLATRRDPSRSPIFQVMLVWDKMQRRAGAGASFSGTATAFGLSCESIEVEQRGAALDLLVIIVEESDGPLRLCLQYNTDLFDPSTIERLAGHFQRLLESVAADPDLPIGRLSILPDAERERLLVAWNDTAAAVPSACIHELFEAQVERTPDAPAVVWRDQQLTYRELSGRANQLARRLHACGVRRGTLVGICTERSLEMLVGILGILKAGGAYLPLDPDYPRDRLEFMLADAQAPLLLTQSHVRDRFPSLSARVVCLDADGSDAPAAEEKSGNPVGNASGEDLAYVIYTSGSTGTPKGVAIEHRATVNLLSWARGAFSTEELAGVLASTSICFDLSVFELFVPLSVGGTVVLARNALDQEALGGGRVTLINTVPSSITELLRLDAIPSSVRTVNLAGEPLRTALVCRLYQRGHIRRVCDLYGPTETTTYSTFALRSAQGPDTVGRPLANTQIYILDADLQPLPMGIPGEAYIGGAGLARGYLHQPERTAEKFIHDPFSTEPGARMYRTGDRMRWLPDGNLEFLGRRDHQVKVRGFRIELGEIESVLARHPAVRETVVTVREDTPGERRLVAYLAPKPESGNGQSHPSVAEMREFLGGRLPNYMLPAVFVWLSDLPRNARGKLDRAALPAPSTARADLDAGFVTPRTEAESVLARICAEVIGIDQVGIHDNFFALGGDSLLCVQVVSRANLAGLRLLPRQMYEHQTVAELAAAAGQGPAISAEQGPLVGDVPLTPMQRAFFEQSLVNPQHFNQALLIKVRQRLDADLLRTVVGHLLRQHDALRLRFERSPDGWRQRYAADDGSPPFTQFDLSRLAEAEQGPAIERAAAELQASLDLTEGPLLRVALFDLGPDCPCRLLLVIHQLAVDAVSWRVLLEDVQRAYQLLLQGEKLVSFPKSTSYREWARRLAALANTLDLAREADQWRDYVAGHAVALPQDLVEAAEASAVRNTVGSSRTVSVSLSAAETQALLEDAPRRLHAPIDAILLAALAETLVPWAGGETLLVDVAGHGREHRFDDVDLTRTVGWFTSIRPVVLRRAASASPLDTLHSVRDHLEAAPHGGLGFGLLRYLSADPQIAAAMRSLPQPEVSFYYLGQTDQLLAGGLIGLARESSGPWRDSCQRRGRLLEVNGCVRDGRLQFEWTYSERVHRRETIERLAQAHVQVLLALDSVGRDNEPAGEAAASVAPRAAREDSAEGPSALVSIRPAGTRRPLFLVHPSGGDVLCYYGLAQHLGLDQPVFGLRDPALEGSRATAETVEAMAQEYLADVRGAAPHGPYRLGGWSFGGLVAYEMACRLAAAGECVEFLGLIDTPLAPEDGSDRDDAALVTLRAIFPAIDWASLAHVVQLPREGQLDYFIRHFPVSPRVAPGGERAQARRMFEIFEAHAKARLAYRPRPFPGTVHLFRAAESMTDAPGDPRLGWGDFADPGLIVYSVPGNHVTMLREPHLRALASHLANCLDPIDAKS